MARPLSEIIGPKNIVRLVEDNPEAEKTWPYGWEGKGQCCICNKPVLIEKGCNRTPVCVYCADPNDTVFVELPPDEFGHRSTAVTVEKLLSKGDWHKTGVWHDQQWALSNVE